MYFLEEALPSLFTRLPRRLSLGNQFPTNGLLGNLEGIKRARVLQGSGPSYRSFALTYAG
jgi:hypothetical protein